MSFSTGIDAYANEPLVNFVPESNEPQAAPSSARIVVAPFFLAGKNCSLSVLDASGKPLSGVGVFVDEQLYRSGIAGTITFAVPNAQTLEISLMGEGKKKFNRKKFSMFVDKVFAEEVKTAEIASVLLRNAESKESGLPCLLYVPSVLVPGDLFLVVGSNFSEKMSEDSIDIDGRTALIYSASQDVIVAEVPDILSLGPLRELALNVGGKTANVSEIDIGKPFFVHLKTETDEVSPEKGKIGMNGTLAPCLIKVVNPAADSFSLWSPKQEPLGKSNILLTPGGDHNFLTIDVRILTPGIEPKIELSLVQLLSPAGGSNKAMDLQNIACRAEIIKLARRKLSAEFRLEELRKISASSIDSSTFNDEQFTAEYRALSNRIQRLSRMLLARKLIFESMGNTDAQYRQVLDDAACGANISLDLSTKPIQIVSDGAVGLAAVESARQAVRRKGRPLRLLEPVIRLLPPMDDSQLSVRTSRIESDLDSKNATGLGIDEQPKLRPNLPEPEPGVSANARETPSQSAVKKQEEKKTIIPSADNKPSGNVEKRAITSGPAKKKGKSVANKNIAKSKTNYRKPVSRRREMSSLPRAGTGRRARRHH